MDPTCRLCFESIETLVHFANECPRLRALRQEILQDKPVEGTDSWAMGHILELSHVPAIDVLLLMQVGMAEWDSSRTPIRGSWVRPRS